MSKTEEVRERLLGKYHRDKVDEMEKEIARLRVDNILLRNKLDYLKYDSELLQKVRDIVGYAGPTG